MDPADPVGELAGEVLTIRPDVEPANQEVVAQALRLALADKLGIDSQLLGSTDAETAAIALDRLSEADRRLHAMPEGSDSEATWLEAHGGPPQEILSRAIREQLAAELGIAPDRLSQLSVVGAAHTLDRLRESRRRLSAEDQLSSFEPAESAPPNPRAVIGRVLREGLAEQLAVSPQLLAGVSAELAAITLAQLLEMRQRVRRLTAQPEPDTAGPGPAFQERRELVARTIRNVIAEDLDLHPRLLGGLSPVGGASLLGRLTETRREVISMKARVAVDELTGAIRRPTGELELEREIRRARRLAEGLLVAAFIDVDSLKTVNDTRGHAAGDSLLKALVEALRSRLRTYDLVIRWGGDEFVCVLPQTDQDSAISVMREVRSFFERSTGGHTFSVGFAVLREDDRAADLIARADANLYASRHAAAERERRGAGGPEAAPAGQPAATTSPAEPPEPAAPAPGPGPRRAPSQRLGSRLWRLLVGSGPGA